MLPDSTENSVPNIPFNNQEELLVLWSYIKKVIYDWNPYSIYRQEGNIESCLLFKLCIYFKFSLWERSFEMKGK